jgi:hypothetical protein
MSIWIDAHHCRHRVASAAISNWENSENSKANRIETMKGPAESSNLFGGSKKNSEENSEK